MHLGAKCMIIWPSEKLTNWVFNVHASKYFLNMCLQKTFLRNKVYFKFILHIFLQKKSSFSFIAHEHHNVVAIVVMQNSKYLEM